MNDIKIGGLYRLNDANSGLHPLVARTLSIENRRVRVIYLTSKSLLNQEDDWNIETFLSCFTLIYEVEGFEV